MNILQRNEWLPPILLVIAILAAFGGLLWITGALEDASTTTAERICQSYKRDLVEIDEAMAVCYNDPFCRLSQGDFDERERLRVLTPRVCAGLRPIMPQPELPPQFFMPNPGITARE